MDNLPWRRQTFRGSTGSLHSGNPYSTLNEQLEYASMDRPLPGGISHHTHHGSSFHSSRARYAYEDETNELEPPDFDDWERTLLAKPYAGPQTRTPAGLTRVPLAPRSLDTQPTLRSFLGSGEQRGTQGSGNPPQLTTNHHFRTSPGLFVTPPHNSGSSTAGYLPSSPSYQVSQRRSNRELNPRRDPPENPVAVSPEAPALPADGASMTPVVQGISLVSPSQLPDRFRSIFPYRLFNAVQSKCFASVYMSGSNLVLSAPTGSGKTVLLELAICQLVSRLPNDQFKVIYMAPTRSLCSERFRDWSRKFRILGLTCGELTGDTDAKHLQDVQGATIVITTPEKWDATTRKWKDHSRLMQLVKLFLVDEVHILKETRGASLEAVVSRMKSVGSGIRFMAVSATVPNPGDIAKWLGKSCIDLETPAQLEIFGEEFRPVKLQKHVYGYASRANDFAFNSVVDSKSVHLCSMQVLTLTRLRLSEVISKHSANKPVMVFCSTRKNAESTAKSLAGWWRASNMRERKWPAPIMPTAVADTDLRGLPYDDTMMSANLLLEYVTAGVAFHHGGLEPADRHSIESAYVKGNISVICCTTTLAVGVNLPCHLVIIKNTIGWQDGSFKEYPDIEIIQMLGRAGRSGRRM